MGEEAQEVSLSSHCRWRQAWLPQDLDQKVDVPHRQAKRFVLAQLFVWRVGGDELPQLGKGAVHVLLPPALPRVCEELPGHLWVSEWETEPALWAEIL